MSLEEPTPAEWKVLSVVWQEGPLAARDVVERLADENEWSASTIKTLLRRLVEKGHLRTKRVGNSFLYSTTPSPMRALRKAGDALLERAGEATVGPLLSYLVKRSRLSEGDLDELRALLDEKEEEA